MVSLGREPQDQVAPKKDQPRSGDRQSLCLSFGAAERRKMFSLGRKPQDQVVTKIDQPRSGGRFSGWAVSPSLWI